MGYDSGPPGASATELVRMAEGGIGAAAAVRAATLGSAQALGLAGEVGTVEVGMAADLLVLDGDPLAEPADPARSGTALARAPGRPGGGRGGECADDAVAGVSGGPRLAEGALLWEPSDAFREASTLADYLHWLERERGLRFEDYAALWRWSVDDLEGFWTSVVDYYDLPLRGDRSRVLSGGTMPGARWFDGAELNYAEALVSRLAPDRPALLFASEREPLREMSGADFTAAVAATAAGLRRLGVGRGDRVAAVIPNIPEAVIALVACASLGAIWSSCSPDFGPFRYESP